jgi:hypothetical protein
MIFTGLWQDKMLRIIIIRAGSIKRSQLEKKEPMINYEAFVEELETGDSFTATVFDILVKVSPRC